MDNTYKITTRSDAETIEVAQREAKTGDGVLFSPASASFDMFKNFEERGNKYKEIVNRLGDVH